MEVINQVAKFIGNLCQSLVFYSIFVNYYFLVSQNFLDSITITGDKISSLVIIKGCGRIRKNKKNDSKVIGHSTMRQHAWITTNSRHLDHDNKLTFMKLPSSEWNILFKSVLSDKSNQHNENYKDRGIDTIQDGHLS